MQNEPNVKRKKEEFNQVSGPLPNQQSSNRNEQQTKVMEILGQLFISDRTSVSREHRHSFSDCRQRPGKVTFSQNFKERSFHLGILFSAFMYLPSSLDNFVNYKKMSLTEAQNILHNMNGFHLTFKYKPLCVTQPSRHVTTHAEHVTQPEKTRTSNVISMASCFRRSS